MPSTRGQAHPEWEQLTEAERELRSHKTAEQLHDAAYEAYAAEDVARAARLFHEAADMAAREGSVRAQASNLIWEAEALYYNDENRAALVALGAADKLGVNDDEVQFNILMDTSRIANDLPLALSKQQNLLDRLSPFMSVRRMGDTKSMVLYSESMLLSDRGKRKEALDKALEAFAEQRNGMPAYNDSVYYSRLVGAYIDTENYTQAWAMLRRWRERGSNTFATTVVRQLRSEASLHYCEGDYDRAWDVLQRCVSAGRQLPCHYGTAAGELGLISKIGCATGRFSAVRQAIIDHRGLRNSESMWSRYRFRFECARYWCSLLESMCTNVGSKEGSVSRIVHGMRSLLGRANATSRMFHGETEAKTPELVCHKAQNWLKRAEVLGAELDRLLECDVRLKEVEELRVRLQKASAIACPHEP